MTTLRRQNSSEAGVSGWSFRVVTGASSDHTFGNETGHEREQRLVAYVRDLLTHRPHVAGGATPVTFSIV
jgi:hypothetical protein